MSSASAVDGGLDYRPSFPAGQPLAVAIVGCGAAAKDLHLPAYAAWNVDVAGVCDPCCPPPPTACERASRLCGASTAASTSCLSDPDVAAVDIATRPAERPGADSASDRSRQARARPEAARTSISSRRALSSRLPTADGVRLAVNQNGRWCPQWRAATLLVAAAARSVTSFAVTHLHDKSIAAARRPTLRRARPLRDLRLRRPLDRHQPLLARRRPPLEVRASDYRRRANPTDANNPWARERRDPLRERRERPDPHRRRRSHGEPAAPFWIHGTEGTIRGSVLLGLRVPRARPRRRDHAVRARGRLVPGGSRGHDGELLSASPRNASPTTPPATTCCRSS